MLNTIQTLFPSFAVSTGKSHSATIPLVASRRSLTNFRPPIFLQRTNFSIQITHNQPPLISQSVSKDERAATPRGDVAYTSSIPVSAKKEPPPARVACSCTRPTFRKFKQAAVARTKPTKLKWRMEMVETGRDRDAYTATRGAERRRWFPRLVESRERVQAAFKQRRGRSIA